MKQLINPKFPTREVIATILEGEEIVFVNISNETSGEAVTQAAKDGKYEGTDMQTFDESVSYFVPDELFKNSTDAELVRYINDEIDVDYFKI